MQPLLPPPLHSADCTLAAACVHTSSHARLQEWEESKARQDQQLENIETGLGQLKEIGAAMGDELARHDVLINEVDEKMDKVTKELQTNNIRLKGMVTKVRQGMGRGSWGGFGQRGLRRPTAGPAYGAGASLTCITPIPAPNRCVRRGTSSWTSC